MPHNQNYDKTKLWSIMINYAWSNKNHDVPVLQKAKFSWNTGRQWSGNSPL